MAQIKFLQYSGDNVFASSSTGTTFYPVTVTTAVYQSNGRTLHDILYGGYDPDNTVALNNGIYAWLEHLESAAGGCVKAAEYKEQMLAIDRRIAVIETLPGDFEGFKAAINNTIAQCQSTLNDKIAKKLDDKGFDDEPAKGSTNLVTSGAIYSYVEKKAKECAAQSTAQQPYNDVAAMDTYTAYDGEVVRYVGETDGQYEHGSYYRFTATSAKTNSNAALCGGDYNSLDRTATEGHWTKLGAPAEQQSDGTDLSNYYTKIQVDNLLKGIDDHDTTYTAGRNIQISADNVITATDTKYKAGDNVTIDSDNRISVSVPGVDLSKFYDKYAIDEMFRGIHDTTYTAGDNITINDNVISAVVPTPPEADLSAYYTAEEVDDKIGRIQTLRYTAGDNIIIDDNTNTISANVQPVNDGRLAIKVDGVTAYFSANADQDTEVEIKTFSGDYNDLSNKPAIPTVNDKTLTIKQGSATLGTFTANSGTDKTITIPEYTQKQADWAQTDTTQPSYINNKPDLGTYQKKIVGDEGDVIYHDGTNVFAQKIMYDDGLVCETDEDLQLCKGYMPSFADIFAKWRRFSHSASNYKTPAAYTASSDLGAWYYDDAEQTVKQPNNSSTYTGFISPKSYSDYEVTVRVYSNDGDDDAIGMVAAFAKDGDGNEHTLSFLRIARGSGISCENSRWCCVLDFRAQSITSKTGGQAVLANKDDTITGTYTGWGAQTGIGSVINMARHGNIITAKCSQFNSTTLDDATMMTIDLDALSSQYPTLNLFKDKSPWGYSTYSQRNSAYENIAIPNDFRLLDLVGNTVLMFDKATSEWVVEQNNTPIDEMGHGRFSYNDITNKLFYDDGTEITKISGGAESQGSSQDVSQDLSQELAQIQSQITSIFNTLGAQVEVPVGTIVAYWGTEAPDGWLICDGRNFSSTLYPKLYELLGHRLQTPNLRGRTVIGAYSGDEPGTTGGYQSHTHTTTVTLTPADLPAHRHIYAGDINATDDTYVRDAPDAYSENGQFSGDGKGGGKNILTNEWIFDTSGVRKSTSNSTSKTITSSETGNMPPYMELNYIIKAR